MNQLDTVVLRVAVGLIVSSGWATMLDSRVHASVTPVGASANPPVFVDGDVIGVPNGGNPDSVSCAASTGGGACEGAGDDCAAGGVIVGGASTAPVFTPASQSKAVGVEESGAGDDEVEKF